MLCFSVGHLKSFYLMVIEIWGVYIPVYYHIWGVVSLHIFSYILFAHFCLLMLGLSQCACWSTWWHPTGPLSSVHFSLFVFPLDNNCVVLTSCSLIHSLAGSNLHLKNPSEFFKVYCSFELQNFCCCFFSCFLLICLMIFVCSHIIFLTFLHLFFHLVLWVS